MILSKTPVIVDSNGVEYYLWTEGALIGYECRKDDQVYYIFLSASANPDGDSDVFLYTGLEGDLEGSDHVTWVSPEFMEEGEEEVEHSQGPDDREYRSWLHSSSRTGMIEGI
jgi:hypothetical protein